MPPFSTSMAPVIVELSSWLAQPANIITSAAIGDIRAGCQFNGPIIPHPHVGHLPTIILQI